MTWLAYIIAAQAEAMYSPYSRLNAIGAYASFVLSVLIVGNIVTSWFIPSNVTGSLTVSLLDGPRVHQGNDYVLIKFNLDADLRSLFNWNTKQLFVYVTGVYNTTKNPLNEVVLWDRIIIEKEKALLHLKDEAVEYPLIDQGTALRGKTITLTASWDIMPIAGPLYLKTHQFETTISIPNDYGS